MAEISKLSKVAIADVAAVDAVLKADIANINGLTIPSAGVAPPLDTYTGAAAAYSVRLLRTAYTGAIMRVRRDSDSVEADVGFDSNNELSLTSPISNTSDAQSYTDFADFVDHTGTPTDAFVRYWYDQSGNTSDAGQSTAPSQPQIYDATTGLITINGKPAIDTTTAGQKLLIASGTTLTQPYTAVALGQGGHAYHNTSSRMARFSTSLRLNATTQLTLSMTASGQILSFGVANGTNSFLAGSTSTTQTSTTGDAGTSSVALTGMEIANRLSFANGGYNQEIIFYDFDQTSPTNNRPGIESDINGFFSIY